MMLTQKLKTVAIFSVLNLLVTWLIALRFLSHADISTAVEVSYLVLVMLGHLGFVLLLGFVPVIILAAGLPKRLLAWLAVIFATLVQMILLLDTFVFDLYRFHLSSFVLDLLLNAGTDVFSFSLTSWLMALGALAAMLLLQSGLWWLAQRVGRWKHYALTFSMSFLALLTVNLWHAWADANYRTDVTAYTKNFPYFYPVTAKRLMADLGLTDPQQLRKNMELNTHKKKGRKLNYPAAPVQCHKPESQPNLLLILVDTLRHDMLNAEVMPNLYNFSQRPHSFSLPQHFSGGNSTKAGVFSLFYGVPVSYWDDFTAAQKPPVLMDRLQELDYEFKVLSSATLVSPAFDRNIFAGLKDVPLYTAGGVPWERDQQVAALWQDWLAQRNENHKNSANNQPFMGFLFFDAVHGYSVPPDFPRFEPYLETVNHLALNRDYDAEPYFNRYKTGARYVDSLVGQVLEQLQSQNLLENTVVVITSDHGESFNEHKQNYWGHGSNYSKEQTQVPVVIHWPNNSQEPVARRTAHADLPVTLMENLLGCRSDAMAYSLGQSVFKEREQEWIISGSYLGEAVLLNDRYVDIQLSGAYQAFGYDVKPDTTYRMPAPIANEVLKALSRFYH